MMNKTIVPNSFVAVSDFHSMEWPLEKVKKNYLNEYDKVFILGDTTDRGEDWNGKYGLDLLLEVKELTDRYPNRIVYIPGNHDAALYDYAKYQDQDAERLLQINGGSATIEDIEYLRRRNPRLLNELTDWLGKQPLQQMHEFGDKKYALAHAFFNQRLYDRAPEYSLENVHRLKRQYGSNSKNYRYISDILWFRKGQDKYLPEDVPRKGIIEIIGHTPLESRQGKNLDLERKDGSTLMVHCVDGGIAYDGIMLKYDGGSRPMITERVGHSDTSPKMIYQQQKKQREKENNKDKVERIILQTTADKNSACARDALTALLDDKIGWYNYFSRKSADMIMNIGKETLLSSVKEYANATPSDRSEAIASKYLERLYDENSTFQGMVDIEMNSQVNISTFRAPTQKSLKERLSNFISSKRIL